MGRYSGVVGLDLGVVARQSLRLAVAIAPSNRECDTRSSPQDKKDSRTCIEPNAHWIVKKAGSLVLRWFMV